MSQTNSVLLRMGLPKGSLQDSTVDLFARAGYKIHINERSYFPTIDDPQLEVVMFRAQEMSRYVEDGVLDIGLTGLDWIVENGSDVHEVCELVYSKATSKPARWVLAVPEESRIQKVQDLENGIIATELVNTTRRFFADAGVQVKKVEFSWGATEVKARLVDAIVDVTETGSSLRANKLRIVDTILTSTTRLIANRQTWKDPVKRHKIEDLALLLTGAIAAREKVGLKMNVPKPKLAEILQLLPAEKSPTVNPLADSDWVAVEVVVDEHVEPRGGPALSRRRRHGDHQLLAQESHSMMIWKRGLTLAGLGFLALALSCQSNPAATESAAPAAKSGPIAVPPGVESSVLTPWQEPALTKARLTLDRVVATLPVPYYLTATPPAATTRPADPPLAAQHAYVEGREAWREHLTSEAINSLQSADRLQPNSPAILRSLGEIYASMGNKMRAALYFEQAATLDSNDAESLFVLGRFALEQGKWEVAIVDFSRALSLRDRSVGVDPGIWSFIAYSLAGALERGGFDAAAIDQYMTTFNAPPAGAQTTHLVRELAFLAHQQGYIWLAIGDARNRMNDPAAAGLRAYQHATDIDRRDLSVVWPRLVYTQLRLGHRDLAQKIAIDAVRISQASTASIQLARYVAAQGGRQQAFISGLTQDYRDLGRPRQPGGRHCRYDRLHPGARLFSRPIWPPTLMIRAWASNSSVRRPGQRRRPNRNRWRRCCA